MANCTSTIVGDLFTMSDISTWTKGSRLELTTEPEAEVCRKNDLLRGKLVKTEAVKIDEFLAMCDKLNGWLPTPKDYPDLLVMHENLKNMFDILRPESDICFIGGTDYLISAWSGQRYNFDQKQWYNPYTNQVIKVINCY